MLAIKKLNNNAVLCRDGQGRDVIAMGRGRRVWGRISPRAAAL